MELISKIQAQLSEVTEVVPSKKNEETIKSQSFLKRLVLAVADLPDKDWNSLSGAAQTWYNDAADAHKDKNDIPDFPDLPKDEEPAATPRRRSSASEPEASKKAYTISDAKVKDEVTLVTKRGKTYTGKITEIDTKDGVLVLKTADGDEELPLDRIDKIDLVGGAAGGSDDEPEVGEPEVGDTIQAVTKRDKTVMGKITEIDGDVLVIKTAAGDVEELDKDRLKSLVIKVKGSSESSSGKRGGADKKDKADEGDGKPSVTLRMRQLICEKPEDKKEDVAKKLKAEGHEFKDGTLQIAFSDTQRIIGILRDLGWKPGK